MIKNEFEELAESTPDRQLRVTEYVKHHDLLGEIMYHPRKRCEIPGFSDDRNSYFCNTKGALTFYVTLIERNFTDLSKFEEIWLSEDADKKYTDYQSNWVSNLENWHCGVTFYENRLVNNKHRAVKFGCDYHHYWDEGHSYSFNTLRMDLMSVLEEIYQCAWIKKEAVVT